MNVNNIHQAVPTIQQNTQQSMGKVTKGEEKLLDSLPSTSHEGVAVDRTELKTTVEKLNEFNDPERTNLKFVFHEDLHEYYVTVVNPTTEEVVREIPPKKMLDMYAAMAKYMGLLVDEKI